MTGSLDQRFAEAIGAALGPDFPTDIALAVSGGGDSMAMLTLAHNWTRVWGLRLWVVTVDHGLRPEAATEAAMVAEECAALGHPHAVLRWHWDGQGNLMDAARRARLDLINRWRGGISHVLMAHTADDLAETFLMRLARGAGVEGLSAMAPLRRVHLPGPVLPLPAADVTGACPPQPATRAAEFAVLRPCLDMRRAELRHYLRTLRGRWVEDPSNDDPAYDRVRMRHLLTTLAPQGLGLDILAEAARRQARAAEALRARAAQVWEALRPPAGDARAREGEILFDRAGYQDVERDTQLRLLAAALRFVAGAAYPPREAPLEGLLDRLLGGGGGTLHGCEARCDRDRLVVFRELAAVEGPVRLGNAPVLWDGRWQVFRPDLKGLTLRALGEEGWRQRPPGQEPQRPHASARSCPAVFDGDRLVACDVFGPDAGAAPLAQFCPFGRQMPSFRSFLLSR